MTTRRAIRHSEIPDQNQFMFKPIQSWDKVQSNSMHTITPESNRQSKENFACLPYGINVSLWMVVFLVFNYRISKPNKKSALFLKKYFDSKSVDFN